jgi:5-methylcytosine-specific restriction endonuclease McrA
MGRPRIYTPEEARERERERLRLVEKTRPPRRRPQGYAAARMRRWRAANPDLARAHRQADKHRRRGAPSDPEHLSILAGDPCAYCGAESDTADHIIALACGGGGEWENLTAACRSCNARKWTASLLFGLLRINDERRLPTINS